VPSTENVVPLEYKRLSESVFKGGVIFLSDGFIQLKVEKIQGRDVICSVLMGGPLYSRKGMNLPGARIFIDPVTKKDLELMDFGLRQGINTFGVSFIESPKDLQILRELAKKRRKPAYLIAKIERREAILNFDEILEAADGIMVARGDLGVEIPIEEVPMVQKTLIRKANLKGKPVITATQMLVSMTQNVRPTRAEANDVANAILDGTDAVMLSEETAMGKFPLEAIKTIVKIAAATEDASHSGRVSVNESRRLHRTTPELRPALADVISMNAAHAALAINASYIVASTTSGNTVRRLARFKPPCWILSFSIHQSICKFLMLSYGVYPFLAGSKVKTHPESIRRQILGLKLVKKTDTIIMLERRFSHQAGETDSMAIAGLQ
jgi:pyruvate kinase